MCTLINEKTIQEKKQREKSALYPAITISECLDFIKQIDKLGSKTVSYASILDLLGLSSPSTKSFLYKISTAKQYGFIITGGNSAQLTDIAKRILYPTNGESESKKLLIEAFENPSLYAKLIERFKDKVLPPKNQLSNILFNEYRIIKQVKDKAAECFIESANYLGLLKNGVLSFETTKEVNIPEANSNTGQLPLESFSDKPNIQDKLLIEQETGYNFEIPTLGKKAARFYIPDGVTEKDIDYIKLYLENMLPVFLENLKSEIKQE